MNEKEMQIEKEKKTIKMGIMSVEKKRRKPSSHLSITTS